ncbi:MAG: acyltransferase [Desulfovibrionaceae bacterium]|nr:acyltransferase [Desulfovibrionaceae bacterium]MBF0513790.1 acyltransferase [Desulfovibrionaceae bacterium]
MKSNTLEVYVENGKDNNFNLIRLFAAMLVLFSHSFAIALGTGEEEPLRKLIGMTPGTMAVDIFFITSGFLVTRSLVSRENISDFIVARVLRIYPALIVSILTTVIVCGIYFNCGNLYTYFISSQTIKFVLVKCISLFGDASTLPGVFQDNAFPIVNGSLWTLPEELKMYGSIGILWVIVYNATRGSKKYYSLVFIAIAIFILPTTYMMKYGLTFNEFSSNRLMLLFYVGGAYYLARRYIVLSGFIFFILCSSLIFSLFINLKVFFATYMLVIPYVMLFIAYVPSGFIRSFNRLGDYSYGVYIYAFPVQQMIVSITKPISPMHMFAVSALISLLCAFLSWHVIERKALRLKQRFTATR